MAEPPAYAAIDLGASSGRVVVGSLEGGRLALRQRARFPNDPVQLPDGLHWNLLSLFASAVEALRAEPRLDGIAVDTWGVDYGLLDARGRLIGLPYHYRDSRTHGMVEAARERVPTASAYGVTGIQTMPINTVFQLLADQRAGDTLERAVRVAMLPDLVGSWLSGELASEITNASTTGLLDARAGLWATELIRSLGLPAHLFGPLVEPGTDLGPALAHLGLGSPRVRTVASHDTASAFAGTPVIDTHTAILSSGTWSLVGVELPEPVLTDRARDENLTNERGVDGTTRLLKNVMGLWLEQCCAREWGMAHEELFAAAAKATVEVALFDPDAEELLAPGDMSARIAAACRLARAPAPQTRGGLIRSILVSLTCKYRHVIERLEWCTGQTLNRIHVIGGGSKVDLLCRLTADVTGREVLAGPADATAIGNLLVQARAAGELDSLADMRAVVAASTRPRVYEPAFGRADDDTYGRFLQFTGLGGSFTAAAQEAR